MILELVLVLAQTAGAPRRNREPSWVASAPETASAPLPDRIPAPSSPPDRASGSPPERASGSERAPWWVYALFFGLPLGVGIALRRRPSTSSEKKPRGLSKPGKPIIDQGQILLHDEAAAISVGPSRTREAVYKIYLESTEALVRRIVHPEKLHCREEPDAPIEMRWRAWLGDAGWDRALIRATGRTNGMALKGLLRSFQKHGGVWTSHAVLNREAVGRAEAR